MKRPCHKDFIFMITILTQASDSKHSHKESKCIFSGLLVCNNIILTHFSYIMSLYKAIFNSPHAYMSNQFQYSDQFTGFEFFFFLQTIPYSQTLYSLDTTASQVQSNLGYKIRLSRYTWKGWIFHDSILIVKGIHNNTQSN